MITDAIINALLSGVGTLLGLLPQAGPGTLSTAAASSALNWGSTADAFFPVSVAGMVLVALLALELALLTWDLIVFIYHQIWGSD